MKTTRRRFLKATTLAAGGFLLPRVMGQAAENPSTDHFWYRRPPTDIYIDSQSGDKAFGYSDGKVLLSKNNGRTWPHSLAFPDARRITFSHVLKNGNVVFATEAKIYVSTDSLKSYREITVKAPDGSDYIPHTPQKPENPGWYFHPLQGDISWDVNGREMMVWGNYVNVLGGAAPVNIFYSTDSGCTVKIAYSFGQNLQYRDNGSPGGGGRTGTLLGDPSNPVICRHVHSVSYNPVKKAFYACTGDIDRDGKHECHWLRGAYDAKKDKWNWKAIVSTNANTRYKCGGINFVNGKVYWISDANGPLPHDRGLFRCNPADIANPAKHELLFQPQYECANMIIQDGVILAAHYATASPYTLGIIFSPDMGKTWTQYDLKEFGKRSPTRFHRKNGDGWFRADLRSGWITKEEVIFIKPKR